MREHLIIIMMYISVCSSRNCPSIYAVKGHIRIEPPTNCIITDNEMAQPLVGSIVPSRHYGLFYYNCSNCFGSFLSKFEGCDDCFFCDHNELLSPCQSPKLIMILSCLLAFASLTLIFVFYRVMMKKWFPHYNLLRKLVSQQINKGPAKMAKKEEKIANIAMKHFEMRMNDLTKGAEKKEKTQISDPRGFSCNTESVNEVSESWKQIMKENKMILKTIEQKNLPLLKDENQLNVSQKVEPFPPNNVKSPTITTTNVRTNASTSGPKLSSLLFLILLISVPNGEACDHTLFLSSENKICEDKTCAIESHGLITLTYGMTLCFSLLDGSTMMWRLSSMEQTTTYKPVYHTSDFRIETFSELRCLGAGDCSYDKCETKGSEESKKKLNNFQKKYNFWPNKTGLPQGETCVSDSVCCFDCFRGAECSFMNWVMIPSGAFSVVYKKVFSGWQATFEISTSKGTSKVITLSSDNSVLLEPFKMFVISTEFSHVETYESLIRMPNNDYFYVNADPINQPTMNHVGDFQVSLDFNSITYPQNGVKCYKRGCSSYCESASPFLRNLSPSLLEKAFVTEQNGLLKDRISIRGTMTMMASSFGIESLNTIKPECDPKVISTLGCQGCNSESRIIISTNYIKTRGIMTFKSNCSFDSNMIICQNEPQVLKLRNEAKHCELVLDGVNKSLIFSVDYLFKGDLTRKEVIRGISSDTNLSSSLLNVFSNSLFIPTFITSFGLCSVSLLMVRSIGVYLGLKADKEIQTKMKASLSA